jgi:predicted RNA-binding Zn ribbon-like protein
MKKRSKTHDFARKNQFFFLGNQLALDFLNTRPMEGGQPREMLADLSDLLHWFEASGLLSSAEAATLKKKWAHSKRARRLVEAVQEFREKLRKEVLAWERGAALHRSIIGELNRLMAAHPMLARLTAHGARFSAELYFEKRQPEDLFAPIADSAVKLLTNANRKRVRKCRSSRCVLHFLDTSKKGNRRWCSMQSCGNRLKVAAYAARQRRRPRGTGKESLPASTLESRISRLRIQSKY